MKRKKLYKPRKKTATNVNKEAIRNYKKQVNTLHFCGDTIVKIVCIKCKEVSDIRTHRPELYTKEIKENYVCLNCR